MIQSFWHLTLSTSLQILISKKESSVYVLKEFYDQPLQSTFNIETNASNPVIDKTQLNNDIIRSFFTDFHVEVKREREIHKSKIRKLIQEQKLNPENID